MSEPALNGSAQPAVSLPLARHRSVMRALRDRLDSVAWCVGQSPVVLLDIPFHSTWAIS